MTAMVQFVCDLCQQASMWDGVDLDDYPPGWSIGPGVAEHICNACQEEDE